MPDLLRPIKQRYWDVVRGRTTRQAQMRALARMEGCGVEHTARLARALRDVVERRFDRAEKAKVRRIEDLRDRLAAAGGSVTFPDFGAGEPGEGFTADQMDSGRTVTMTLEHLYRHLSQRAPWTHLMFKLLREFKPTRCVEFGTCVGLSACYQAAALELNGAGQLITLEGAEPLAHIAEQNFRTLGLTRVEVRLGRFRETLAGVLREYGELDFAFIDGHHDEAATLGYFEQISPHLSDGAVLLFDDILWYPGMARAWRTISARAGVAVAVDLGVMGACIMRRHETVRHGFELKL